MFDSKVSYGFLDEKKQLFPLIIAKSGTDPLRWFKDNKELIEENILKYGGFLFRNFGFRSVSEFNNLVNVLETNLLDYEYRSTPRTRLGGKIYTATEYPADQTIPLHNENSYTNSWPQKIYFFCVLAAKEGGQTPVADSRKVYNLIDPAVRNKFKKNGIMYVRNFIPGIDLSWQEVFQTTDPNDVANFCGKNKIAYSWLERQSSVLQTKQICQATLKHPKTNENVWFNQAHLFHISALPEENVEYLLSEVGKDYLPRNSYYGDGSEIDNEDLNHIRDCYEKEKIIFSWQDGDVMILDNILFTHGRERFKGPRKVVVAMS